MQRQQADPGKLVAGDVAIEAAEQLIAAADGEERLLPARRQHGARSRLPGEVVRDERLLAVLAAADVEEVDLADRHRVADADRAHLELVPAQPGSRGQHGDVPAVGVDVQVVRIEVADPDPHAARSQ